MIQERSYQARGARQALSSLRKHHRVLLVGPTGSGKTVVGVQVVRKRKAQRVLWLAHRFELLDQARAELITAGVAPEEIGLLTGTEKSNPGARYLLAGAKMASAYLDGETLATERAALLESLSNGNLQVVVNVDVLSEGFDCPPVKVVALCRPTKSLTRFLQQTGRGSRKFKGQRPVILDHAGNCWRFGLPHAEREWSLTGKAHDGSGEATVKVCPECEALIPSGARECPECGCEQPLTEHEREQVEAELELLAEKEREREFRLKALHSLAKSRGLGSDWIERAMAR